MQSAPPHRSFKPNPVPRDPTLRRGHSIFLLLPYQTLTPTNPTSGHSTTTHLCPPPSPHAASSTVTVCIHIPTSLFSLVVIGVFRPVPPNYYNFTATVNVASTSSSIIPPGANGGLQVTHSRFTTRNPLRTMTRSNSSAVSSMQGSVCESSNR